MKLCVNRHGGQSILIALGPGSVEADGEGRAVGAALILG
jgi:hypothetical protein